MHWPQITWIVLAAMGIGLHIAFHGKPRVGNHSAGPKILRVAATALLLYCGGFFSQ